MKYSTFATLFAATLGTALPLTQTTSNDAAADLKQVRIQIESDAGATGRQVEVPVGQLIEVGTSPFSKADAEIFAIRLRGQADGIECVFNYLFEKREERQAKISVGNDFQTGAPSGFVNPIDFRCDPIGAANVDAEEAENLEQDVQAEADADVDADADAEALAPAGNVRIQIESDAGSTGRQVEVPVGQLIEVGTSPFSKADAEIFAIRLRGDIPEGLECVFDYLFEKREERQAIITVDNDFQTGAPSGFVNPLAFKCE